MVEPKRFAELLTLAIHRITNDTYQRKFNLADVQYKIAVKIGREKGGGIEFWRRGNIPPLPELEKLAEELVKQKGLKEQEELKEFLQCAGYPHVGELCHKLFPLSAPLSMELAPFVVGVPIPDPRQFFGRERELKRIFNALNGYPLQNVAVIGLRRSGKTSLLHYLEKIHSIKPTELRPEQSTDKLLRLKNYQWIFVDFQDWRMQSEEGLLRHLLRKLKIPEPASVNLSNFMELIEDNKLERPTVILMDEIEAALSCPEFDRSFWGSLRSLVCNQTDGKLAIILTATKSPYQVAHDHGKQTPFFNIFGHTLQLGPWTEREAREFVKRSPQRFSDADVGWILEHSGGWPCLMQILCDTRLNALKEGVDNETWQKEGLERTGCPPVGTLCGSGSDCSSAP